MIYDLAIIGGGPAGYSAAAKAGKAGLKVILFEKATLGGVCLNEGCMPTKTLLHSTKLYDNLAEASRYGIGVENPKINLEEVIKRKQKIVRRLVAGVRQKLTAQNVEQILSKAQLAGEDTNGNINISTEENNYTAKQVILASGSESFIPPIKGLTERNYWTSREALDNKEPIKSLIVIGGGVIGTEFASFYNSIGTKVTVIEMLPEILGNMDKELSKMLRDTLSKKGIDFHIDVKVDAITATGVTVKTRDEEEIQLEGEKILLSTGRIPLIQDIGLENVNIEMYGKGIKVDKQMRTSHPRIFACGDITGQYLLAHTAIREAEVAVNTILGLNDEMSYKAIPSVVYTSPEVAGVGMTKEQLEKANTPYKELQLPMAYAGRFMVEHETGSGVAKILIDQEDKIIGCHILGSPASEIIVSAGIAIEKGFTIDEFKKIVFPHPTVGEILHDVLNSK